MAFKSLATRAATSTLRGSCMAVLCILAATTAAQATTKTYALVDVAFDDGGTANGFISFDSSVAMPAFASFLDGYVVGFDIATQGGNTVDFPEFVYSMSNAVGTAIFHPSGTFSGVNINLGAASVGARAFRMNFDPSSLGSGSIALNFSSPYLNQECYDCFPQRLVVAGSIALVPEPATPLMLLSGIAVLAAARRLNVTRQDGADRHRRAPTA